MIPVMNITENVKQLLSELGPEIQLLAAAKSRTPAEVYECVEAGVKIIGQNYLKDAQRVIPIIGNKANWHFIGHLQRNKIPQVVALFDAIETLDNLEIATLIDKECFSVGKVMPVLIEVNSGEEVQKAGVVPDKVADFIKRASTLKNIKISGLMTMGPLVTEPEEYRPYFKKTRQVFEHVKAMDLTGVQMLYLSMGMTDSYRVAIEEGANVVRIGSKIFGPRF
jgi:pyridoxal phosphate enzyme (YggS family)